MADVIIPDFPIDIIAALRLDIQASFSGVGPVPVLTIASSKGGPGKTTVAMLLAGRLAADRLKVVAIDADPTAALARWAQNTYEGPAFSSSLKLMRHGWHTSLMPRTAPPIWCWWILPASAIARRPSP